MPDPSLDGRSPASGSARIVDYNACHGAVQADRQHRRFLAFSTDSSPLQQTGPERRRRQLINFNYRQVRWIRSLGPVDGQTQRSPRPAADAEPESRIADSALDHRENSAGLRCRPRQAAMNRCRRTAAIHPGSAFCTRTPAQQLWCRIWSAAGADLTIRVGAQNGFRCCPEATRYRRSGSIAGLPR